MPALFFCCEVLYNYFVMEKYYEQFDGCIQKEIPYCQATCPFHLDVKDFVEKVQRGTFNAAYKTFRNAVSFPVIVAELCYEPCKINCPRGREEMGGCAIELKALEKTVVREATSKEPLDFNVPKKDKHIAVIGAGISGLVCALRLASKKYSVTVYEATSQKGGSLLSLYPDKAELFIEDIELQMKHEDITYLFDTKVESIAELAGKGYDAVYIATGRGGTDFGLLSKKPNADYIEGLACFAGGSLRQDNKIEALADGIRAAAHIEAYLKTGNLLYPDDDRTTKVQIDPSKTSVALGPAPDENGSFSREDAVLEARRCLKCSCDSCMIYCDLVNYTNKWPLRIKDEVKATMHKGQADIKPQPAKRLINFCTHCGLCKEVCPAEIDMDNMFLEAKAELHGTSRMPWGFHDFWQRDMENANGPLSSLIKAPPHADQSGTKYAFFPGCQLGASEPSYVIDTYKLLLDNDPGIAMFLQCCGVPVKWAGNTEAHKAVIEDLRTRWKELGKPTLIVACPSCIKNFTEFLPEIPLISLYEYLVERNLINAEDRTVSDLDETMSVFDPCASRGNQGLRQAVRTIAESQGVKLEPLPVQEEHSACCSFGGQVAIAGPKYADYIVDKRISESDNPYITYCINCRDAFLAAGKKVIHILDPVLGRDVSMSDAENGKDRLPTVTERRRNRYNLKKNLLKEVWSEDIMEEMPKTDIKLVIGPEMRAKLDKEKIFEDEIAQVIEFCERTGRKVENLEKGSFTGYKVIGNNTYWAEYRKEGDEYHLLNAYFHRMKINLEAVWNGKRVNEEE